MPQSTKYKPKDRDVVVVTHRHQDQFLLVSVEDGEAAVQEIARGSLHPKEEKCPALGKNGLEQFLEWARLSGRFIHELACSNPSQPYPPPSHILRLKNAGKGFEEAEVVKAIPVPPEIMAAWGRAGQTDIENLIRESCKFIYDISHRAPISIKNPKLNILVERQMQTPQGEVCPTDI